MESSASLMLVVVLGACTAAESNVQQTRVEPPRLGDQVSEFVRRIHQDRAGHMWFGTNGDGVLRYDGSSLERFDIDRGFGGAAVRAIAEDDRGDLWFGTSGGVTRYDGQSFTNYTTDDGLISGDVWCLCIDRQGVLWVGTLGGVCRFDPATSRFTSFWLPPADRADPLRGVSSRTMVHSIIEDSSGDLWFAQSTAGVYRYDGAQLTLLSAADGLASGSVNCILEDRRGHLWFATHHDGVFRYDGEAFVHVSQAAGLRGTEAWSLFEDRAGNVWFPIENAGLYRFDGTGYTLFARTDGLVSEAVQCTFEDREGRIWCGGHMGLCRLEGARFVNVTRDGPW